MAENAAVDSTQRASVAAEALQAAEVAFQIATSCTAAAILSQPVVVRGAGELQAPHADLDADPGLVVEAAVGLQSLKRMQQL